MGQHSHGTPQQVRFAAGLFCEPWRAGQCGDRGGTGSEPAHGAVVAQAGARAGHREVWKIAPGRGRKPRYDQATRAAILEATLQSKPAGMSHWSCRLMAEAQGVSKSTVNRLWQLHNLSRT